MKHDSEFKKQAFNGLARAIGQALKWKKGLVLDHDVIALWLLLISYKGAFARLYRDYKKWVVMEIHRMLHTPQVPEKDKEEIMEMIKDQPFNKDRADDKLIFKILKKLRELGCDI